jgi:AAA domain-containing protein
MTGPVKVRDIEPEAVEWLWRERIPRGMITVVGGRPEQGKGLFASHLAAEISQTEYLQPDGSKRLGRVIYNAVEDSHSIMTGPRIRAAGGNIDNVEVWRFQIPAMFEELEAQLKTGIDLLVIDPVAAALSHGISRHTDRIRNVLTPLSEMLEQYRTACVMIEHVNKRIPKNGHPLNAIGGAGSGLPAASRMAFVFGKDPADDDSRVLCAVKSNLRETPKAIKFEIDTSPVVFRDPLTKEIAEQEIALLVMQDDEVDFSPNRLFDEKEGAIGRPADRRAHACEWLVNYLWEAGEPVRAGLVAEDAKHHGLTSKTLRRAAEDMKIVKQPPGGGRSCTWELPDEILDALKEPDEDEDEPKDEAATDETTEGEDEEGSLDEELDNFLGKLLDGDDKASDDDA